MRKQRILYLDKWSIVHFLFGCIVSIFLSYFFTNRIIVLFLGVITLIIWEIFENIIMVKYVRRKFLFFRTTPEPKKDTISDLIIGTIAIIIIVLLSQ